MSKVIVEKPNEDREVVKGVISINPNNPAYGSIMLSSTEFRLSEGGFMNQEKRVSFISGQIDQLEKFVDSVKLIPECDYSQKVGTPMKLIVLEQTIPFFEGQQSKINPSTGEELLTADGKLIYRRVALAAESSGEVDNLIQHVTANVTVQATANVNVASKVE